ncbi:hypothetical protein [Streptomyces ardesiacus]|uniref:hypothetical protein n=1 Tax=Streptomyces ardesiacus TaxID=285564 RepID=UPI0036E9F5F4
MSTRTPWQPPACARAPCKRLLSAPRPAGAAAVAVEEPLVGESSVEAAPGEAVDRG